MNLFKAFGIKKKHEEVLHDIPEFIPHPEIPGATIRNPEYTKYKHSGVTPPGEFPAGEGTTEQEYGPHKILADTFSPEKEGKLPYRGR